MKHVIRIGPWWLRVPLLLVLAVPAILEAVVNYRRNLKHWPRFGYWVFSVKAMWCAIRGDFVPR